MLILELKDVPVLPRITLSYLSDLAVRLQQRGGGFALMEAVSA